MPVVDAGERIDFEAIGTRWRITTERAVEPRTRARIDAVIARYDRAWSRFRADSGVSALARDGGPRDLGEEAAPLLGLLARLRALTDGAVDPLVAAPLAHLGYGPAVDLVAAPGTLPAPDADVRVDGTLVTVRPPALLDVGSAGKGQLADLVLAELVDAGHERCTVDAGGDVVTAGGPLRVALEHPFDLSRAIGVVELEDGAIAGSAANRRAWTAPDGRSLHHVLDARTGLPVEAVAATWALAGSALLADGLATALMLVPPAVLEAEFAFRWIRMGTDGRVAASPGIAGELFS